MFIGTGHCRRGQKSRLVAKQSWPVNIPHTPRPCITETPTGQLKQNRTQVTDIPKVHTQDTDEEKN